MAQHQEAVRSLSNAKALRKRVRAESVPSWFPLLVFGCLLMGAIPLYVAASNVGRSGLSFVEGGLSFFGGVQPAWYVTLYWMIGIPTGFVLSALFCRRYTEAVGVGDRSTPFTAIGLALFGALLLFYSPVGLSGPWLASGNLLVRGLLPLLAISLALGSLAVIARSVTLGLFTAGFLGLTLAANLYNMENIVFRLGWTPSSDLQWQLASQVGMAVCGIALLLAAGVSFFWKRARGPSS